MLLALTRPVSQSLAHCQLTHLARTPIDIARAKAQHAAYEQTLQSLGTQVVRLPAADDLPDAVFIEDTAVVVEELAVITRPGAAARRAETAAVAEVLAAYRRIVTIDAPGTLDGGDVLRLGKTLWAGLSSRTNAAGIDQLRLALQPFGYHVHAVPVTGCLHLKSAATAIADDLLLVNPAWAPRGVFGTMREIAVDPAEPYAANALRIHDTLIFPEHFPRTRARLEARGLKVAAVPCDELAKAEGAVTCCSILLDAPAAP